MLKKLYMNLVSLISAQASKKEATNQVVYLLDFPQKNTRVLEELIQLFGKRCLIFYTKKAETEAKQFIGQAGAVLPLASFPVLFLKAVPSLSRAKIVFADNYFAFLGGIQFQKNARVLQLWHAVGAIKKFGLNAVATQKRTQEDKKRFVTVYEKFTDFVVASKKMGEVFEKSWQAKPESIQLLGNGFCDSYFEKKGDKLPIFQGKKIYLYAPTFRKDRDTVKPLDFLKIDELMKEVNGLFFVKRHPEDKQMAMDFQHFENIYEGLAGLSLEEFLLQTDCLISDYSSIPFEYVLGNPNGRVIFYCYDYEEYRENIGIETGFEQWACGKIVQTQEALQHQLQCQEEKTDFTAFNTLWNTKNDGLATKRLIEFVKKIENEA